MAGRSPLERLVRVAAGIAVFGTIGVNIAWRALHYVHRSREYCTLPVKALEENEACMKLIGGGPVKVNRIDLSVAEINARRAKGLDIEDLSRAFHFARLLQLTIQVEGRTKSAEIYAMSTRDNTDTDWFLQYAILKVVQGPRKWIVWLHPKEEESRQSVPEDVQKSLSIN